MYTLEQFEQDVNNSAGLVCYGTGRRFQRFVEEFAKLNILKKLLYCVDADERKHHTKMEIEGKCIPVYPPEVLASIKNKNIVLLITNLYYGEVLDSLKKEGYTEGIRYYCFTHLYGMFLEEKAMMKKIPSNIKVTSEPVIPKKIHYCWFGGAPLPDKYQVWLESWKKYCPDYEIIRWDESNYDIRKNRYMHEAYQCKKWGFVPDYARLDIVYEHGGIYMDTDVELVANLDDMLYQKAYFGFEREEYVALGLGFGAVKGMPMIAEMREFYESHHFLDAMGRPNLTASPVYQTEYLIKKGLKLNGEYQRIGDAVIYPEKMLSGKCSYTRRIRLASYTKSIHHYDASWADDEWKERNKRFEQEMNSGSDYEDVLTMNSSGMTIRKSFII